MFICMEYFGYRSCMDTDYQRVLIATPEYSHVSIIIAIGINDVRSPVALLICVAVVYCCVD